MSEKSRLSIDVNITYVTQMMGATEDVSDSDIFIHVLIAFG